MIRVLGIIPARGGSKGVKNKNIRRIAGEPLIQYAINACKASKKLTQFVVSTDSKQIREIADKAGCVVIDRPDALSTDTSSVVDAALHTLSIVEESGNHFDAILLIQPTSPIRTGEDLDKVIGILETSPEVDAVVSVVKVEDAHPARMYLKDKSNLLTSFLPEYESTRRQDLPSVFHRNGSIYLVRREPLVTDRTFMPQKKAGYVMDSEHMVNIDTERDVVIAEIIVQEWKDSQSKT